MKFHFTIPVWGHPHIDLFLRVVLPSQLSRRNLSTFPHRQTSSYKVYTTRRDAEVISSSPAYAKLSDILSTEIVLIDDLGLTQSKYENKYKLMKDVQKCAIRAANEEDSAIVFLFPDLLWADGAFETMANIAATGKQAIMAAGFRVCREAVIPVLLDQFWSEKDSSISISSRDLMKLALGHIHPMTKSLFWGSRAFSTAPWGTYWDVGQEGFLLRAFVIPPLMVHPVNTDLSFTKTVDYAYVPVACPDHDKIHVVEDSDEILWVELTGSGRDADKMSCNKSSVFQVAHWAYRGTLPLHRRFVRHTIRFHVDTPSRRWKRIERSSDWVVGWVLFLLHLRVLFLFMDWRRTLTRIKIAVRQTWVGDLAAKWVLYPLRRAWGRRNVARARK